MKSTCKFFLVGIMVLASTFSVIAQDSDIELPRSIIKFVPFELTNNTFMLELETFNAASDKSISVGVGLTSGSRYDGDQFGVKGELMYRVYLKGLSVYEPKRDREPYLRGVYAGVFTRGGIVDNTEQFYYYNPNGTSTYLKNSKEGVWFFPGVMIGATRTLWEVLFLEVHVGAGVRFNNITDSNPLYVQEYPYYDVYDVRYKGVAPNMGFKIGVKL